MHLAEVVRVTQVLSLAVNLRIDFSRAPSLSSESVLLSHRDSEFADTHHNGMEIALGWKQLHIQKLSYISRTSENSNSTF